MNDFLDNLGKAAKDAAKKAMKISGNAVEVTKASVNIKLDESKLESFFREIGKVVYEAYKKDPSTASEDILDFCKCLDEIEKSINDQKIKLAGIAKKRFCVNCGLKIDKDVNYCYSCGAKQPEIIEEEEEEDCCCCCDCEEDENSSDDCCCEDSCCCDSEKTDADDCCDCEPQENCETTEVSQED